MLPHSTPSTHASEQRMRSMSHPKQLHTCTISASSCEYKDMNCRDDRMTFDLRICILTSAYPVTRFHWNPTFNLFPFHHIPLIKPVIHLHSIFPHNDHSEPSEPLACLPSYNLTRQNSGGLRSSGHKGPLLEDATIAKKNSQVSPLAATTFKKDSSADKIGRRRRHREATTEPSAQQFFRWSSSSLRPR